MASTAITRPTPISRVHKKFGERLGLMLKKTEVKQKAFDVRVYAMLPTEIVCHIIEVNEHNVVVHRVRKSGSSKMDFSYIPMNTVISIDGDVGKLGRVLARQEQLVTEYRGVQVKTVGGTIQITDQNKDVSVLNLSAEGIRYDISAEADAPTAPKKSVKDKKAASAKKKPAKKANKRRNDDDDF